MSIADRLIARVTRRPPDFQIGGADNPYCNRWWVIPRNRWLNIYLHQFVRDDDDRALHDHPWPNCSIVLRGWYYEIQFEEPPSNGRALPRTWAEVRDPGDWPKFPRASLAHRIVLPKVEGRPRPCWSLFLTGPVIRDWGFWCPLGRWVHWRDFTAGANGELVGQGCDASLAGGAAEAGPPAVTSMRWLRNGDCRFPALSNLSSSEQHYAEMDDIREIAPRLERLEGPYAEMAGGDQARLAPQGSQAPVPDGRRIGGAKNPAEVGG